MQYIFVFPSDLLYSNEKLMFSNSNNFIYLIILSVKNKKIGEFLIRLSK